MPVQIPNAAASYAPSVPSEKDLANPRILREYLQRLTREVTRVSDALFDNDKTILVAINSGTSGTFASTITGIVVTSGIVTAVTT